MSAFANSGVLRFLTRILRCSGISGNTGNGVPGSLFLFPNQAFRQGNELNFASVGQPCHAAIGKGAAHDPLARSFQGANTVTSLEARGFAERLNPPCRGFTVQYSGDEVSREGGRLPTSHQGEVGEEHIHQAAGDFGEGVPVEKKERRGTMTTEKKIESFEKGQRLGARFLPFFLNLPVSFLIMAVLSAPSFARSAVEADDRLPTPVLDKRGSGL